MKDKHVFFDTNILVYAHDQTAGIKGEKARRLVEQAWDYIYPPAISVQVLQEFYVNLSKGSPDKSAALKATRNYYQWEVIPNDLALLDSGFEVTMRWKLSFWDSLIIAAAMRAKAEVLFTEDLQAGQRFDFVTVVNPLSR